MQANLKAYKGGGIVFIDITTKKPITTQWRKTLTSATKYWSKHFKHTNPNIVMKPVADVQFFFMQYEAGFE